jgi:hypothetical protein
MGTTRTEQAIDELEPQGESSEYFDNDDVRLGWLAAEADDAHYDPCWSDR